MPYPASIVVTGFGDRFYLAPRRVVHSHSATVRFALVAVTDSGSKLRMCKSTDSGETWAQIDISNEPELDGALTLFSGDIIPDPSDANKLIVAWFAPQASTSIGDFTYYGQININTFDMSTETWGTAITGGPRAIRAFGFDVDAGEDYRGAYIHIAKDAADGSYWVAYLDLVGPIGTHYYMRPKIINCSSGGAWGTPVHTFASTDASTENYHPTGLAMGDSRRVHLVCNRYAVNPTTTAFIEGMDLWHQSVENDGTINSVDFIADEVFMAGRGAETNSPITTRAVGGATELLIGYGRHGANPFDVTLIRPYVARAISSANPTWSLETPTGVNATNNNNTTGDSAAWCQPLSAGSTTILFWPNNRSISGIVTFWFSILTAGTWSAPVLIATTDLSKGEFAFGNLLLGGASLGLELQNGFTPGGPMYYEIPISTGPTFAARYRVRP